MGTTKAKISYSPHMPEEYKKAWKPHQKTRGILALYYYWCYQLGIFPKGTDYKPTSPLMKEELRNWMRLPHRYAICRSITSPPLSGFARRQGEEPDGNGQALPTIGGICRIRYGVLHPPRKKRPRRKKTG